MSNQADRVLNETQEAGQAPRRLFEEPALPPIPNYTLATICPSCDAPVIRRACKVRCDRCGFMWDCSEL